MSKKALIVVDMQNDFLPGGSLSVEGGDEIIPVINRIQQDFDIIVATQDWHPAGHFSFASSHQGKNAFDVLELGNGEQVLWPDHCVQGTPGAQFSAELNTKPISAVFRKGMDPEVDSYSGFFDNNRAHRTGMAGFLRDLEVTDIYVAGLAADICVYYTARDGQDLGFQTHFVENAAKSISQDSYVKAKRDLHQRGIEICTL
ncbi:bifunctional nicotinamidase/pyrazinamidase [Membranicola marinus]|uniref:nicotinamidase n=1 Tax=Membranihabitans marinus TaxID=1227546 RepID=A0A953HNA6_9BACT|nr:bifunctional nicotinamidase/pyrazinamidase [Membranihabitans marinus]MBY5957683.1 bifunctional nicotinamidase/pyrazinamidase [Membranihabitans marinus]